MTRRAHLALAAVLASLVAVAPLAAHEISAPDVIQADGSGAFTWVITVTITSPIEFAYAEWDGTDNTDVGVQIADGFCMVVIEPGTQEFVIAGNLLDPTEQGSLTYTHAMCDGWDGTVSTTVLPPSVSVEQTSFSTLRERYR
jgi:hypothetical protein